MEFQEVQILEMVKSKRKLWKKGSGRNLHAALQEEFQQHGIKLGRDKFFDLLRKNGLLIKPRRRKTNIEQIILSHLSFSNRLFFS